MFGDVVDGPSYLKGAVLVGLLYFWERSDV